MTYGIFSITISESIKWIEKYYFQNDLWDYFY